VTRTTTSPQEPGRLTPVVHLVEDDEDARAATARLLRVAGYVVETYSSASEFLSRMPTARPGCLVLDVQLPGPSGLELQKTLAEIGDGLPIVFVTGHGDIPMSVRAIKSGAVDFLTKPVRKSTLLEAVAQALARDGQERAARESVREARARYERLTPREREVFAHLISGQLNKQVAFDLGAAERTIKIHRHNVMQKLEADSIADLIRVAVLLQIDPVRVGPCS
jgi:FixJ family two-component response regulator